MIAATNAALSLAITAGGVLAGASRPYQLSDDGVRDSPASASVGTFGSIGLRWPEAARERLDLAALDLRHQHRHVAEERLDLAAEQIGQRRRRAAIGHVDELDAGRG